MILQSIILCGGAGTRLWPLSRQSYPKQFLSLAGDNTLLQDTVARLDGIENISGGEVTFVDPLIVCNEAHRFLVAEQLRMDSRCAQAIMLEPIGRNTAPALTIAALTAMSDGTDPVLIVMPADHVIADAETFRKVVASGAALAADGAVVTFGIVPTAPETGYGYILRGEARGDSAFTLAEFVEKPDAETAQSYLDNGAYYWNSGIFMMKASVWLADIATHRPEIEAACRKATDLAERDGDFLRVDSAAFNACPSDSIDYAVMERISGADGKAVVLPLDAGWSDVGAWSSLWEINSRDEAGNACHGDVVAVDTRDCLLMSSHRLLATVGVEDLVIVETPDSVLVANRHDSQKVKEITEQLRRQNRTEVDLHRKVHRPWGSYEGVDHGERFQVKRLTVNPLQTLSLQMHHHRAEHWIVVSGTARVTRGEEIFLLSENESTYIPLGTKHRLENPGNIPLEIIEIQSGTYLGEDDIVRFEDLYNRSSDD
ncbi:MAG TPA: mannose-1-phosphate guanylyltransferase/mannose-6-phosphate isomerase [Chromatiales bacterium]|nr:mannose-1-phosphate guanylyltransferase/mannose-6-phosphate isomerase [Chromatiales bacterium]